MMRSLISSLAAIAALACLAPTMAWAQDHTLLTDADATVRVICRNDQTEDSCNQARGEDPYVRVHQDNNLDTGYFHFDLGDLGAESQITEARFQLDSQTNSWGDTTVSVYAIADPDVDWDLDALPESEINVSTAPQSDWESFEWTGDPGPNNETQQRFNDSLPFLDEGDRANSIVRELGLFMLIDNQDAFTDDAGNSYGGVAGEGGPGTAGSADGGDNVWPVKDVIDIDVTDLVQWKLGQNPDYSTFDPKDRDLTILVRTDGDSGFVRFITNESNFLGGELDLEPGRLALSGNIIIDPVGPTLQAGDADRDLDFDQLDLVQVQVAAKYLTGQAATWGEGDWNGAPGGSQDSPPAGNGLFDTIDVIAALNPGHYLTGPYAAIEDDGDQADEQTSIVYDVSTGELGVNAPASTELTSINIDSAAGIFTGQPAENLGGSFDNDADGNIFKATFGSSFGSLSFGNVAQSGLSKEFVLSDLTVVGSLAGGGDLGAVDLIYIPEPSAVALLVFGMTFMIGACRFRRRPT